VLLELHYVAEVRGDERPTLFAELGHEVEPPFEPAELGRRTAAELEVAVLLPGQYESHVRLLPGRPIAKEFGRQRGRRPRGPATAGRRRRVVRPAAQAGAKQSGGDCGTGEEDRQDHGPCPPAGGPSRRISQVAGVRGHRVNPRESGTVRSASLSC